MIRKKLVAGLMGIVLCMSLLAGCGDKTQESSSTSAASSSSSGTIKIPTLPPSEANNDGPNPTNGIKEPGDLSDVSFGLDRTEFNTSLDLDPYPLTANEVADDFTLTIEAEDGEYAGNVKLNKDENFSGGAYLNGQSNSPDDTIKFKVTFDKTGFYRMNFRTRSADKSARVNYMYVDGVTAGDIICGTTGELYDSVVDNVYLEAGEHEISIVPYWGYTDFDCLTITKSSTVTSDTYNVTCALSNPNADEHTKMLYKFLCDIYGKYTLTGQYADRGRISLEYSNIEEATGAHFAVLGLDMSAYSTSSLANSTKDETVPKAYDFYNNGGGIVQMCWHWTAPAEYVGTKDDDQWWNSFYKEHTTLNLDKIMNGEDQTGYDLLMKDIDSVANNLKRLCNAGVPVIWRPLHEASGGWFWWGNCSADSYKKLWNVMYDKMTNEHGLTNLIWMWNGQNADWYPGDETVDIVAWDIYAPERCYQSYSGTFAALSDIPTETKLVALSENGVVMDPDLTFRDNARWLFWGTWSDPFTLKDKLYINEQYTETSMLKKAYECEHTLTLEELPDLKNYY